MLAVKHEDVPWIMASKPDNLYRHISKCAHVDTAARERAKFDLKFKSPGTRSDVPVSDPSPSTTAHPHPLSASASAESMGSGHASSVPLSAETAPSRKWTESLRRAFDADVCRLLVAVNLAWWAVDNPFWRYFFEKWIEGCYMPGRITLSGRILDEEAGKVQAQMKDEVHGRFGTGQCDGWKNIAKRALIGSMVNVEYKVSSLPVRAR